MLVQVYAYIVRAELISHKVNVLVDAELRLIVSRAEDPNMRWAIYTVGRGFHLEVDLMCGGNCFSTLTTSDIRPESGFGFVYMFK